MTLKKRFSYAVIVGLCCATAATAQETLGNVTFPISCDAKVQARFNRAVAMQAHRPHDPADVLVRAYRVIK